MAGECRSRRADALSSASITLFARAGFHSVVLGSIGIGADILEEARAAYFKHRDAGGSLSPADFARFLQNGNDIVSCCFGASFGRVQEGFTADLAGHLVFGMASAHIETVIVNGSIVMEGRSFPWDTEPAFANAREQARRLWQRMDEEH